MHDFDDVDEEYRIHRIVKANKRHTRVRKAGAKTDYGALYKIKWPKKRK
jgi:hypothetical protein